MNILIYKGQFQYNVVDLFIDKTIYFLEKKEMNVTVINLEETNAMNQIIETFSKKTIDCVVAFNGIGVDIKLNNGQYIYDAVNTIFLAIYVDHPAHHMGRLSENLKNQLVCFNDKEHVNYINKILPNHHKIAFFLPHGGLKNEMAKNSLEDYKKQKSIDIVFAGTFMKHINKKWEEINVNFPKYILDEICEVLIYDDYASVHKTFFKVCTKYGIKFSTIGKVQLSKLLVEIIKYVRSYKRVELLKEIAKSGLNITICGNGWKDFAKEHKNINYMGPLDIKENLKLIAKAKILINITPNFTHGSHERVFTGMLNNTVLFSDKSSYYDEFFEDKKNNLYYSFTSLEKDIEKLKEILKDDEKLFSMSQNAYEIANKYHTWENRVDTMLEMVNLSKFMDM